MDGEVAGDVGMAGIVGREDGGMGEMEQFCCERSALACSSIWRFHPLLLALIHLRPLVCRTNRAGSIRGKASLGNEFRWNLGGALLALLLPLVGICSTGPLAKVKGLWLGGLMSCADVSWFLCFFLVAGLFMWWFVFFSPGAMAKI